MKPLGHRLYGSIPHLLESRLGQGDHHISPGQDRICTFKTRDKNDLVIVQEKLDGSCCGVALKDGVLFPMLRKGYLATTSPYVQHQMFAAWVYRHRERFRKVLREGERIIGEWLARAHGTQYVILDELWAWRPFDIMEGHQRLPVLSFTSRIAGQFHAPCYVHAGDTIPVLDACDRLLEMHTHTIPVGMPEGLVYRVERNNKVDFLAKFVFPDHVPGRYFDQELWNWSPE